jgi:HAD superfamily hydrolase (TIGR01509 family)
MITAVLFDWRGILVHDPPHEWWLATELARCGREASTDDVAAVCTGLRAAEQLPEVRAGEATCDCSAAEHRAWSFDFFQRAGLDDQLASALYDLDLDPIAHNFYPDVAPTLEALHRAGLSVAVVSDIHFDLRPEFRAADLDEFVDEYVLSYEHGVQKPDPRVFDLTLNALGVVAAEALMVGDRASHDGGAVACGITTLLLPGVASADDPVGLAQVLRLIG